MEPKKDLVGKKFGCLTVLDDYVRERVYHGTKIKWLCRCDCGNEYYVQRDSLIKNKHDYCPACRQPGVRNEKLYHVYYGIIQRCENEKNPRFYLYGGKGVRLCDEWRNSYDVFKKWSLDHGYIEDARLSIDRIDSNGNYCPENCRWITISENSIRADIGRVKNHSKLTDMYAISPSGERFEITNIAKFAREHTEMSRPAINAILNGRMPSVHKGWTFHSNKTRDPQQKV